MTPDLLISLRAVRDGTPILLSLPEGLTQLGTDDSQALTVAGRLLLEALEARARLLAPVGDADPGEVLRLDGEATPEPWDADHSWWPGEVTDEYAAVGPVHTLRKYDFLDLDTPEKRAALDVAMAGIHADEKLIAYYRTAAPKLAREVARLRLMVADYQALAAHREGEIGTLCSQVAEALAALPEDMKRIDAELRAENARLQKELDAERQRFEAINEAISARSWGLFDVLGRLAEGADHLFTVHGCDAHGYETLMAARDSAREIGPALLEAMKLK